MTKQELLDIITSKVDTILSTNQVEAIGNVKWYVSNVVVTNNDVLTKKNINFYVVDEGLAGEAAYWQNSNPYPTPVTPDAIIAAVDTYLAGLVTNDTIKAVINTPSVDVGRKVATASVIVDDAGTLREKKIFLYKDGTSIKNYIYE